MVEHEAQRAMALVATPVGHMYSSLLRKAWSSTPIDSHYSPNTNPLTPPRGSYFERHADIRSILEEYVISTEEFSGRITQSQDDLELAHAQSFGTVTAAMAKAAGERAAAVLNETWQEQHRLALVMTQSSVRFVNCGEPQIHLIFRLF